MPKTDSAELLRPHLAAGERLEWSDVGGPIAAGPIQRMLGFVFAGGAATILTLLAGVEGALPGLALPVLFLAVFAVVLFASRFFVRRAGSRPRVYGITDQRVLVLEDGALQSFGPAQLAALEVEAQPDGSHDLFWGWKELPGRDRRGDRNREGGLRIRLHARSRLERIGFVGLASPEPAEGLIRSWLRRRYDAAAQAAGPAQAARPAEAARPAKAAGGAASLRASSDAVMDRAPDAPQAPRADWRTVREPAFGFAIDVPGEWHSRVGLLKRSRVLGIRIESPEPKWFDSPGPGWNRLEVKPGIESAVLQVDLDPPDPPAQLEAVTNDKWSKIANVKLLDTHPDLRIGGLTGFGVTQGLKGAGIGVGGVRIGESLKADLVQTQMWLRGAGRSVHVIFVAPTEATALREAMERVVGTLRLE